MRCVLLVFLVLSLAGPAGADIYFEITSHGVKPIGMDNGGFPFYYTGSLDVYAWGSGADTSLRSTDFDIVFDDIYGHELQFYSLGTVDPLYRFNYIPESAGSIAWDRIEHVQLTSASSVSLPQTPSQALLLYEGFEVYFDGLLRVVPQAVSTNTGSNPVIHSYGVVTTPEPVTAAMLAGGVLLMQTRRSRSRARW